MYGSNIEAWFNKQSFSLTLYFWIWDDIFFLLHLNLKGNKRYFYDFSLSTRFKLGKVESPAMKKAIAVWHKRFLDVVHMPYLKDHSFTIWKRRETLLGQDG